MVKGGIMVPLVIKNSNNLSILDLDYQSSPLEQVEQRLQQLESLQRIGNVYKMVFDKLPIGICMANKTFDIVDANIIFCEQLNYGKIDIIHKKLQDIIHTDDMNNTYSRAEGIVYNLKNAILKFPDRIIHRYITRDKRIITANTWIDFVQSKEQNDLYFIFVDFKISP